VEKNIKEINEKYRDRMGHDVIYYKFDPILYPSNVQLMRELDFFTVTPLEDGRNLTADEFVMAQSIKPEAERGYLLLGNCGTQRVYRAHGLGFDEGVIHVDVTDTEGTVNQWVKALKERPKINQRTIDVVNEYDVKGWFMRNIEYLGNAIGRQIEIAYR